MQIPFRRNETMYVLPQADRIVIVYSVCFDDKTDQAIARVFLQVSSSIVTSGMFRLSLAIVYSCVLLLDYYCICRSLWTRAAL